MNKLFIIVCILLLCCGIIKKEGYEEEKFYRGTSGWGYALIAMNDNKLVSGFDISNLTGEQLGVTIIDNSVSASSSKDDSRQSKKILHTYSTIPSNMWGRLDVFLKEGGMLDYDKIVTESPEYTIRLTNPGVIERDNCALENLEYSKKIRKQIQALGKTKFNNLSKVLNVPVILHIDGEVADCNPDWLAPTEKRLANSRLVKAFTTRPLSSAEVIAFKKLGVALPELTARFNI